MLLSLGDLASSLNSILFNFINCFYIIQSTSAYNSTILLFLMSPSLAIKSSLLI